MSSTSVFVIFILAVCFIHSTASPCSLAFSKMIAEKNNSTFCQTLSTLEAEFGWKISDQNKRQIDIVFGTRIYADMGWLAWGVNPGKRPQMVGTRAMIGIVQLNGSLYVGTYNITKDTKLGCRLQPSVIDVDFRNMSIDYSASTDYYTIKATVVLPSVYDISTLSHVWQVGYRVEGTEPMMHPAYLQNVDSAETINLETGESWRVTPHHDRLRKVHGIVNIVGWGTLLPIGVIFARYFRYPIGLKTRWYDLHKYCQIVGYTLGTAGWIIGLWLGHSSRYYTFNTHRLYADCIFAFATLQVLALRLRPKDTDEYRKYWNMYHHFLGYALLAVITINIFLGIAIFKPDNQAWKWSYIGVLATFFVIVTAFEIWTWTKFVRNLPKPTPSGITLQQGSDVVGPSSSPAPQQTT